MTRRPAAEGIRPTQRIFCSICPAEGVRRRPNPPPWGRCSRRPEGGSVRRRSLCHAEGECRPDDEETRRPPQDEKSVPAPRTSDAEGRIILRQGSLSRAASKKEVEKRNKNYKFLLDIYSQMYIIKVNITLPLLCDKATKRQRAKLNER